MSYIKIKDINTHYIVKGQQGLDVILLPGWGQNTEMMKYIQDFLAPHFRVYALDWPGFGKTEAMTVAYSTDDYTDFLKEFINKLSIKKPILIGHSFGCRIAIRYASYTQDVYKMVLTGAAGLPPKKSWKYYFRIYTYKIAKKFLLIFKLNKLLEKMQKQVGSSDYKSLSGAMQASFVKIVNEDVSDLLDKITAETLLVFGENDLDTPLWMGKYMAEKIPNAGLAVFENQGHYAYFYQHDRFNLVLEAFLKEDYYE